jgi:hypothetical protein
VSILLFGYRDVEEDNLDGLTKATAANFWLIDIATTTNIEQKVLYILRLCCLKRIGSSSSGGQCQKICCVGGVDVMIEDDDDVEMSGRHDS